MLIGGQQFGLRGDDQTGPFARTAATWSRSDWRRVIRLIGPGDELASSASR